MPVPLVCSVAPDEHTELCVAPPRPPPRPGRWRRIARPVAPAPRGSTPKSPASGTGTALRAMVQACVMPHAMWRRPPEALCCSLRHHARTAGRTASRPPNQDQRRRGGRPELRGQLLAVLRSRTLATHACVGRPLLCGIHGKTCTAHLWPPERGVVQNAGGRQAGEALRRLLHRRVALGQQRLLARCGVGARTRARHAQLRLCEGLLLGNCGGEVQGHRPVRGYHFRSATVRVVVIYGLTVW